MKPAPFDYFAPTSVEEALDRLTELGYSGKVLAGGQSLIPAMNFRMARPAALVDLNKVTELSYIKPTDGGGLAIGTMTRVSVIEDSSVVKERFPIIAEVMPNIAHKQIRNRGTFGGAIAHADPAAQIPALSLLLDAKMRIQSKKGERIVDAQDFFMGPFMTVLEPEDLLTDVLLPGLLPGTGCSYKQISRQRGGYAQAAAISKVVMDGIKVKEVSVVLFSVAETPVLTQEPRRVLVGQVPTAEAIEAVAAYVAQNECDPGTDIHGTTEYRRNLVHVLVRRSLNEAVERARK